MQLFQMQSWQWGIDVIAPQDVTENNRYRKLQQKSNYNKSLYYQNNTVSTFHYSGALTFVRKPCQLLETSNIDAIILLYCLKIVTGTG